MTETHVELAALVGVRQDEVSRLIADLCRHRFTAKRDRDHRPGLVVLDVEALAAL